MINPIIPGMSGGFFITCAKLLQGSVSIRPRLKIGQKTLCGKANQQGLHPSSIWAVIERIFSRRLGLKLSGSQNVHPPRPTTPFRFGQSNPASMLILRIFPPNFCLKCQFSE